MFKTILTCGAIAVGLLAAVYPQTSLAEGLTSTEFLTWQRAKQDGYLTISVTMSGVIAAQIDKEKSKCIDSWYAGEERASHKTLLDAMRQYGSYHPQGIVLWVIQNQCGQIGVQSK